MRRLRNDGQRSSWNDSGEDGLTADLTLGLSAAGAPSPTGAGGAGGAPDTGDDDDDGTSASGKGERNTEEEIAKATARTKELETALAAQTKKNEELLRENIARKKRFAKFEEAGVSFEEITELRSAKEKQEQKDREARGAYEEQLSEERQKRVKLEGELEKRIAERTAKLVENEIMSAAGSLGVTEHGMTKVPGETEVQIVTLTKRLFEFDPERGEVVHRTLAHDDGRKYTVREFFEQERSKSLANWFASRLKTGAGADGASGAGGKESVQISRSDPNRLPKVEAAMKAGRQVVYTP